MKNKVAEKLSDNEKHTHIILVILAKFPFRLDIVAVAKTAKTRADIAKSARIIVRKGQM